MGSNPDFQWEVKRIGATVQVDLTKIDHIAQADTEAIVAATERFLKRDEVTRIQLDGPVLESGGPLDGLEAAIESLDELASRYGKRLVI